MTLDDETTATYREAFAATEGAPRPETCPPPDRLWVARRGELSPHETRNVVEHLAECADCAADWRLAGAVDEETASSLPAAAPSTRPARSGRLLAMAAGVVAMLAGAGLWYSVGNDLDLAPGEAPVYRQAAEQAIASRVAADDPLPRGAAVLSWSEVEGEGIRYNLLVSTAEFSPVAEAQGLEEPRYTIPEENLAAFPSGTELRWLVEAVTADGERIASPTFTTPIE